jgi:uncharacterized protein YlxW (UPF0749 family)
MTLVCVMLGVIVSWQFLSVSSNSKDSQLENMRMDELRSSIINEKDNNDILRSKIASLQSDLEAYKNIQGDSTELYNAMKTELQQAKMIAGLTNVKGKGLIITLSGDSTFYLDYDILLILNELRASDVQAISINDQRVVATTEVRRAGSFLMVNNKQVMMPIEIKAIADPVELENALKITGGVLETIKDTWQITMKRSDDLFIPKVPDDGTVIKTDLLTPVE